MAYIDLTFNKINKSLAVGDTVYYTDTTTSNGFTVSGGSVLIGNIISIVNNSDSTVIKVDCELDLVPPTVNSFIYFSKDNTVNISSVKGYYGLVEFKNNSTANMELFSVGCEVSESSK